MSPQSPSGSARGRYAKKRNGRVKKQAEAIRQLAQEGRKLSQIAKEVEIARASVRRVIARQSAQEGMAR
jgi:predicted transposase YdaD